MDSKTLKSRYRELVKSHHPDTGGDVAKMAQITSAYDKLRGMTQFDWTAYHHHHHHSSIQSSQSVRGSGNYSSPYRASASRGQSYAFQDKYGYSNNSSHHNSSSYHTHDPHRKQQQSSA
uniref:Chaperone protein DnaJ n=1 Tax=Lygus hesperus TaxID=30085 RepID=A0A0A9W6J6_LYGHE